MRKQKHTQGKLTYVWPCGVKDSSGGWLCATEASGKSGATEDMLSRNGHTNEENDANAARLVECWNSHDSLIVELTRLRDVVSEADVESIDRVLKGE